MKDMKIKITNPHMSARVQELLFKLGYKWRTGGQSVRYTHCKYLYTYAEGDITWGNNDRHFYYADNEHVTIIGLRNMLIDLETTNARATSAKTPQTNSATEWTIKLSHSNALDMHDVLSNLSRDNPIALLNGTSENNYIFTAVLVHRSLARKAHICEIAIPNSFNTKHVFSDGSFWAWLDIKNFGDAVNWARRVRHAKWPEGSAVNPKIKVVMPAI